MTIPPVQGSGDMPAPNMAAPPVPSSPAGGMPILDMDTPAPAAGPVPLQTGAAPAGGMPARDMNAAPSPADNAPAETPHEREKLAAFLRDRQNREAEPAGTGQPPVRGMNTNVQ